MLSNRFSEIKNFLLQSLCFVHHSLFGASSIAYVHLLRNSFISDKATCVKYNQSAALEFISCQKKQVFPKFKDSTRVVSFKRPTARFFGVSENRQDTAEQFVAQLTDAYIRDRDLSESIFPNHNCADLMESAIREVFLNGNSIFSDRERGVTSYYRKYTREAQGDKGLQNKEECLQKAGEYFHSLIVENDLLRDTNFWLSLHSINNTEKSSPVHLLSMLCTQQAQNHISTVLEMKSPGKGQLISEFLWYVLVYFFSITRVRNMFPDFSKEVEQSLILQQLKQEIESSNSAPCYEQYNCLL